ncbi:MAG: GAF domain-containing protein [Anaerolineales bacterium]|nr:GAF domain-containing protein [Anaerolineales bacterium]
MTNPPESTVTLTLAQQLSTLAFMAEQISRRLKDIPGEISKETRENLTHMVNSLNRFSKQIEQEDAERQNLQALANIGQVINSSLNPDEVLRIVMDTIIRLTGAERGFLMLRNQQGELAIKLARNWEQESLGATESEVSRTIINRVVLQGKPVLTTNAQEDPRFHSQESVVAHNLRSILCVPLKLKDDLTGVIYADNRFRTGIFTEVERDLLSAFANQAAVAIENARLFESVRRTLAEVSELKNLMDNVFDSIVSGVITADVEDKITLINRAAGSILGYTNQDLVGTPILEILESLADSISPHISTVRQTDQSVIGLEIKPTLPQRGQVNLRFTLSPLKDADHNTQGVAIVLDDLTEQKQLEAQRRLFERMVSPKVIEQLDPDQISLGGRRGQITTLFADIRGFTAFSEKHSPEELVAVLNQYIKAAADAVLAEEGTIDKFMGDAIMAWFNAPIPQTDHALRAVKAALGLKAGIEALHRQMEPEAHLSFGAGIHFGDAVLGLIGTEQRIEYTAIGDSVNTAKRIQENASRGQILISHEAYQLVKQEIMVNEVQPVQAKGKSEALRVYQVLGLKEKRRGWFG